MKRRYTETDKELMKIIGENLKRILKRKGLQQKDVAELVGLSTSAVSDYANGKALMNPGTVQMFADALKVTKADIDPTYRGTVSDKKNPDLDDQELNPFVVFELVDKYTDDEIIEKFQHYDEDGQISEEKIRMHLQYVRFLKSQK